MKKLLFLFATLITIQLFAQSPCSTVMPQEQTDWLKNYKLNNPYSTLKTSRANGFNYIPVKVHIVGTDAGEGYYKMRFLLNTFCILQEQFRAVGFHFYIYGDIQYINNSDVYEHQSVSSNFISTNNDPAAVNVYFVEDPSGACGYYSRSGGGRPYIMIRKSCGGIDNSTVAHELGHYFSLPHTFSGWEGRSSSDAATNFDEKVNGSNCAIRGDGFCDTPADFISDRWNCPYNGNKLDANGDRFEPDGSLFMSYANDACQNKFSEEQMDAMIAYLNDEVDVLLRQPEPDTAITEDIELYFPSDENNLPFGYVNLKWNKVDGATHYFVTGTRFTNPNAVSFEFITTDTSTLIENLTPGFRYRWKVQPYNGANTCRGFSEEFAFTTLSSDLIPGVLINGISCPGENDGSISLNPAGGDGSYNYEWSTGDFTNSISNLTPGNYSGTVTDNSGNSVEVNVDIVNPLPLKVTFTENGSIITAVVTGGKAPYTYEWQNGVNNVSLNNSGNSYYSVYVTDANGCVVFNDVNGSLSIEEEKVLSNLKVFPNPLTNETTLNIEVNLVGTENVSLSIIDIFGKNIINISETASSKYTKSLGLNNLSKGIYLVKLSSGNEVVSKRILIQ